MQRLWFFVGIVVPFVWAQEKGRILSKPIESLCLNTKRHLYLNGTGYYYSWKGNVEKMDWLGSRNFCRKRCMETVSFESEREWSEVMENIIHSAKHTEFISWIWTSGKLCDFDGCEKSFYVKPININGWFWSGTNTRMSSTTCLPHMNEKCFHRWSNTGMYGFAQPDNREYREFGIKGGNESCLSLLVRSKITGRKIVYAFWHDRACYHKSPFICEDSKSLFNRISH
ncbi:unnamed protein product [Lepeophtheirus salmonis]|uniref:(salmon louse) hypothetical protein n=2 Tax=Lepeophtheirus salmonis TaxID=72036 RepID=A0A7R8CS07_LEPSM|nr:unnamed protein product [Lepeophtheirus salmonis]CAF2912437.1 unnamed protein product [Lepeophtheirus salmonis]